MNSTRLRTLISVFVGLTLSISASSASVYFNPKPRNDDREIAARFAPIFYQALGDNPRSDYITNFDFDGDWRGDNNWDNAANEKYPLNAYIYFSVAETTTHFFIQYAVFHPRDYKGGEVRGAILSGLIREGVKRGGKYDPTGLAEEATLAHENDMEGALVTVEKRGMDLNEAKVVYVETLHHNNFSNYVAEGVNETRGSVMLEGPHPVLYVEPKGHGIEAFSGDQKQTDNKKFLRYAFTGKATNPTTLDAVCSDPGVTPCRTSVGYDLVSLKTLWDKARANNEETYGVKYDYGEVTLTVNLKDKASAEKKIRIGKIGCAFLGKVGGQNMARPPWGWISRNRTDPPGAAFFNPALSVKRDYGLNDEFSVTYVRLPFWAE
jgi:hypothetical protein